MNAERNDSAIAPTTTKIEIATETHTELTPDPIALLLADKRSAATRRAYKADLCDFFGGTPNPVDVERFISLPAPRIALELAVYKNALLQRGLSEATVNRKLAAIRSLLKLAHRLGYASTDGRGLVDSEKVVPYRDTRGIDIEMLRELIKTPGRNTIRGQRDTAILRLLCENALRRAEVCALNVGDFSAASRTLMLLGKGRGSQKIPVTLSDKCTEDITNYLLRAGHAALSDAPLFQNLDRRPSQVYRRLTADGLYYLIKSYGRGIGVENLTPHKLRHSAITAALDVTNGDVRKVQRLSRHADLRTLSIYDDNRTDMQGEVTGLLSGLL